MLSSPFTLAMTPNMEADGFYVVWVAFWSLLCLAALLNASMFVIGILPPVETFFLPLIAAAIFIHTLPVIPWVYLNLLDPIVGHMVPSLRLSPDSAKTIRAQSTQYTATNLLPYWNWSAGIAVAVLRSLASGFYNIMFDFDNSILNCAPIGPIVHWLRSLRTGGNDVPPQNDETAIVLQSSDVTAVPPPTVVKLSDYNRWCKEPRLLCQDREGEKQRLMRDYNKLVKEIDDLNDAHQEALTELRRQIVSSPSVHQFHGTIFHERRVRKGVEKELEDAKQQLTLYQPEAQHFAALEAQIKDRDETIKKMEEAVEHAEGSSRTAWRFADETKRSCDAMIEKSRETAKRMDAKSRDRVNEALAQVTLHKRALDDEKFKMKKIENECKRLQSLQSTADERQSLRDSQRASDEIRHLKDEIQSLQGTNEKIAQQHQVEIQSLSQHANHEIRLLKDEILSIQKTNNEITQKQEIESQSRKESQRAKDEISFLKAEIHSLKNKNQKVVKEHQLEIQSLSQRANDEFHRLREEIQSAKASKSAEDAQSAADEIRQLKTEIKSLQDTQERIKNERIKSEVKSVEDPAHTNEVCRLTNEIKCLRESNQKISQAYQSTKQEVKSLQHANETMAQENQRALKTVADLQHMNQNMVHEYQGVQKMIGSLKEKISLDEQKKKNETASLNEKLAQHEQMAQSEIASLNEKLSQEKQMAQTEITSLNEKLAQQQQIAQNEIASLNQKIALEQQNTNQDQKNAMSAFQSLQEANQNLTQENQNAMHTMQSLQEANQKMVNERQSVMNEIRSLQQRITQEHDVSKTTIKRLQETNENISQDFQRAGNEVARLRNENQTILAQQQSKSEGIEKENKTLRAACERYGIANQKLEEANTNIQGQLDRLRVQTDRLLESLKEERRNGGRRPLPSSAMSDVSMEESEEDGDENQETDVDADSDADEDDEDIYSDEEEEMSELIRWAEAEMEKAAAEDRAQAAAKGQKETFTFAPEASSAAPANPFTGPVQPLVVPSKEDFEAAFANLPGPGSKRPIAQFKRRLPKKQQEEPSAQRPKGNVLPGTARKAPVTSGGLKKADAAPATPQKKPGTRRVHFTPETKKEEPKGEPIYMTPESKKALKELGEKPSPVFSEPSPTPFEKPFPEADTTMKG